MAVEVPSQWVPVQDYGADMVRDMLSVKDGGKVRILPCSASLDVFNQSSFIDAARTISKTKAAGITIFTGPVIVTREDGFSGLLQLADEGVLSLVHDSSVSLLNHNHTVEQDNGLILYEEEVHNPFDLTPRGRQRLNHLRLADWQWQREGEVFSNTFDGIVDLMIQYKKDHPEAYEGLPILLTQTRLDELVRVCKDTKTDLAFKTANQLLGLPIAKDILL